MGKVRDLLRLLRPAQWTKNTFVLTGLVFGHAWGDLRLVREVFTAAAAFCLLSSATYVVNDVADIDRDRRHPTKRLRPLATGAVTVRAGLLLAGVLAIAGLLLGRLASPGVFFLLLLYAGLSLSYSFRLRRIVLLDVFVIASGFMLRILAGTEGVGIPPSRWLLLCGLMLTLFLGFAKRRAEADWIRRGEGGSDTGSGRYTVELLDATLVICAAGVILAYSLYTMSPDTIRTHGTENLIYTVPFIMYGIFRYLFLLLDRTGGADPAGDLLRDPHLLLTGAGWLLLTILLIR